MNASLLHTLGVTRSVSDINTVTGKSSDTCCTIYNILYILYFGRLDSHTIDMRCVSTSSAYM